jgi:hypothetical protein
MHFALRVYGSFFLPEAGKLAWPHHLPHLGQASSAESWGPCASAVAIKPFCDATEINQSSMGGNAVLGRQQDQLPSPSHHHPARVFLKNMFK